MAVAEINNALAKVSTAKDMKDEMAITMGPNANWEEFIAVSPMCIAILGDLICISTAADFTLEKKPPKGGFKLLKYPNSFRASLVQVANSGWDAFNTAHDSMDQIRLLTSNVPGNLKQAVQILLRGTNEEMAKMLPIPMTAIQETADECLELAKETQDKYLHVENLIAELMEACVNAKGQYEQELRDTEITLAVAQGNKRAVQEQKEMAKKQYETLERAVKAAEDNFNKAMDNMPAGMQLLKMNIVEGVTNMFTGNLNGVSSMCTAYNKSSVTSEAAQSQTDQGTMEIYSKAELMQTYSNSLISKCIDTDTLKSSIRDQFDSVVYIERQFIYTLGEIRSITNSLDVVIRDRAIELCLSGIKICGSIKDLSTAMQDPGEEGKSIATEILKLHDDIMIFFVGGTAVTGSSPTGMKSPCQRVASKQVEERIDARTAQQAIHNARFKIEQASANLEFKRDTFGKSNEKMMESSRKLGKILAEMQALDITKVNFEQIKQTLFRGINALAQLKEEWSKLVKLFTMMSNLVKCSLNKSLKKLLDYANVTQSSQQESQVYSISHFTKDIIYQQAFQSAKIAYVVNMISGTYVEVSSKYLMDRMAGLAKVLGYDPEKEADKIIAERNKLYQDMNAAQARITNLVKQRKGEFDRQVDARINKIKGQLEAALPPDDASSAIDKERIQTVVQKGLENVKESKAVLETGDLDIDDYSG